MAAARICGKVQGWKTVDQYAYASGNHMSSIPLLPVVVRFVLLALLLGAAPVRADEAADLAQKVHERPNGRDFTTLGRMVLTEKGRAPRIREIVTRIASTNRAAKPPT